MYQLKGFLKGDESGQMYTIDFNGENAESAANQWLDDMGRSFELFNEQWAYIEVNF